MAEHIMAGHIVAARTALSAHYINIVAEHRVQQANRSSRLEFLDANQQCLL